MKKKETIYVYEGSKLPVKAEIVGKCLTQFSKIDKKLTPRNLVEFARSPQNPLHKCFEWDNSKAADNYRIEQARNILSTVKIKFISNGKFISTRAFVNIKSNNEQFYLNIDTVIENNDYMQYLFDEGKKELLRIKDKYSIIKQFQQIFQQIEKL